MKGYVARKGNRWYAVIYHGLDPITGREQRSWHAAGTDRHTAEKLARTLAAEIVGRNDDGRSLTFGAYLTQRWLPAKRVALRASTYDGYRRKIERHILPTLGRVGIRRLTATHLESLYEHKLRPTSGDRALAPKTVLELHVIIRGALADAHRKGIVTRNVAAVANAPKLRSIPPVEPQAWTAAQLQAFLRAAAQHRMFPAFWLSANTGMRRSELLGLRWTDIDFDAHTISVNRGIVSVGYERCESRGKTRNSRRVVDLDTTTTDILAAWQGWQHAAATGINETPPSWLFPDDHGEPLHPHALSQTFERIARRAGVPIVRLHDLRHTHATLLIKAGVPVKVVSERLGHATPAFTIQTYQHVLPGMQADAARTFEQLLTGSTDTTRLKPRQKPDPEW
jgi:integrase